MTAGRNDPCPCGSGKKYKRCCLAKDEQAHDRLRAQASRWDIERAVVSELARFAERDEFREERGAALRLFELERTHEITEADSDLADGIASKVALYWLFDHGLPDDVTPCQAYLRRAGSRLDDRTRTILERLSGARLRAFEVQDVARDQGLHLQDLWSGAEVFVTERAATHQLTRWDVLAARVARDDDGTLRFQGGDYLFPARLKQPLVARLREAHDSFRAADPGLDEDGFLRHAAPLIHRFWLDKVVFPPPPTLLTAEGDLVEFGRVRFDVLDEPALRAGLAARPDVETNEDRTWTWFEEDPPYRRSLGQLSLESGQLLLEVTSRERARRGRRLVEEAGGAAVRHRSTRFETLTRALAKRRSRPEPEAHAPQVPEEVEAELVREFKERHYRTWPDQPLPALDGHTPREAASSPTLRRRLVDLLKEMENAESRSASARRSAYDFGRIRSQLGLDEPSLDAAKAELVVDAGDLGMALTWHGDETSCYLDTRSGEVLYRLDDADDPLSEEDLERGLAEGRYVPIEPIPSSVSFRWMEEFADTVGSRRLRELLAVALDGRGAFHRFKDALRRFPVERERWFAFEAERLDQEARRWLRDNGIEATLLRRRPPGS